MKSTRGLRRSYRQACTLAGGLDIIGERWTLLIVRELTAGPKRFRELEKNLPGIGPNLLTARLRYLERQHLVARARGSGPSRSVSYLLTASGTALEPTLVALAQWGIRHGRPATPGDHWSPVWNRIAFAARFHAARAVGLNATFSLCISGFEHGWVVADQKLTYFTGRPPTYDARLECSEAAFRSLAEGGGGSGLLAPGSKAISGNRALMLRFLATVA